MDQPKLILLLAVLIVALITDLWKRKIYNILILVGLLSGLLLNVYSMGLDGVLFWVKGSLLALALFLPLYVVRGMAAGDVKLMMVIGGILGLPIIIDVMLYVYLAGGALALVIVLFRKQGLKLWQNIKMLVFNQAIRVRTGVDIHTSLDNNQSVGKMPYATAIFIGTLYALFERSFVIHP